MCGRFALDADYVRIKAQFNLSNDLDILPRYNIAPSMPVLFICQIEGQNQALKLQWGLLPAWAKTKKIKKAINVVSETVFEKRAFRKEIQAHRGIMVMSGFFEWRVEGKGRQPYYFKKKNDELIAVAALWDTWHSGEEVIHSCALLTTEANPLVHAIHQRMPAILVPSEQTIWMNNHAYEPDKLSAVLHPYQVDDLCGYPVTRDMNHFAFQSSLAIKALTTVKPALR